jgi:hypothetical protein
MKPYLLLTLGVLCATPYLLNSGYKRWGTRSNETHEPLPGDEIVPDAKASYTLASTIAATPSVVWPWLVQMGQGRAGFYTFEWIENLIGADIHNADTILPQFQSLNVGDEIRLTPNPYLGRLPGQFLVVDSLKVERVLVLRQTLPNGLMGSWSFVLRPQNGATRLLFRRRGNQLSLFDRLLQPGYLIMDLGMLHGIRKRAARGGSQYQSLRADGS